MGYSDAEIQAFKEKDKRIVRQSCLKVAVQLVTERPNFRDDKNLDSLGLVKEMAGELVDWVYEKDQDLFVVGKDGSMIVGEHADEKVGVGNRALNNNQQLPEPTLQQKKVLDAIAGKQNKTQVDQQLKAHVLDWAEETHGQRSYPTKLDSVETFLKWFNK